MSNLSAHPDAAVRDEVTRQLQDLGSLFIAPAAGQATFASPTNFGLVQTKYAEANPIVLNAAAEPVAALAADSAPIAPATSNVDVGLILPVPIASLWEIDVRVMWLGNKVSGNTGLILLRADTAALVTEHEIDTYVVPAAGGAPQLAALTWQGAGVAFPNVAMTAGDWTGKFGRVRIQGVVGFSAPTVLRALASYTAGDAGGTLTILRGSYFKARRLA